MWTCGHVGIWSGLGAYGKFGHFDCWLCGQRHSIVWRTWKTGQQQKNLWLFNPGTSLLHQNMKRKASWITQQVKISTTLHKAMDMLKRRQDSRYGDCYLVTGATKPTPSQDNWDDSSDTLRTLFSPSESVQWNHGTFMSPSVNVLMENISPFFFLLGSWKERRGLFLPVPSLPIPLRPAWVYNWKIKSVEVRWVNSWMWKNMEVWRSPFFI